MERMALVDGLRNNIQVLRDLVLAMPEKAVESRVKDYWTVREHLEHLVICQKMLLGRMEQFFHEERPAMRPYNPDGAPAATKRAAELLDEFESLREKQLSLIEAAGDDVWRKAATHPEYKEYGFEILVRHTLLHDSFHMCRMEELWLMKEDLIKELN